MDEKTLEEKIYIFYKKLNNKLKFFKKISIENIEKDIKNEKIEGKRTEYIDLIESFYNLFENEIKLEIEKNTKDEEETSTDINDEELPWE